ncbi:hypothetical protein [Phaeobacter sp. HF9A]|uniref:hypothetical protein n=1 Tax=Phaeobacter sp. HF9A TaxID=2721561 RepID=UPI001431396A|nr:hypothetical protein [Phaeobacter sp. HF9A]NIZ13548.1 hypothetical protein [Phaeobacter sp. HF9A]
MGWTPILPDLAHDCSRCAALCCVAYPFEKDVGFGINKAVDTPCPKLSAGHACTIHRDLIDKGFSGCVAYSCAGAGQRVTQELFDGESWREDPDLLHHMTDALRILRPIHEALLILCEARAIAMPDSLRQHCEALIAALCPEAASSIWDFTEPEVQEALAEVPEFIPQLAPYVQRPR